MKILLITLVLMSVQLQAQDLISPVKFENPVKVLNMGTFHMGYTSDATRTEFDQYNQKNIDTVHGIARKIADFRPTVIVVESLPSENKELQERYRNYLLNPHIDYEAPSEIELLAFEVGRLAGASRIYGVDQHMSYNYGIAKDIPQSPDKKTYFRYFSVLQSLQKEYPEEKMSILQKLQMSNQPAYKDLLININADILTHIANPGKAEGAGEAAKFYHRNLVMYSNLNQIKLSPDDRVFILMGATHTAFFDMWMKRSPKYELVDVFNYLN